MRTKKLKQRRKQPQRGGNQGREAAGTTLVLRRVPVADTMIVALQYVDPTWIVGNNTQYVWSERFYMNSAYDPNPSIGGGSCTYFPNYAALFKRYRVLSFSYAVEFVNQMDSTVIASVAPTKDDLGANYSGSIDFGEINGGKAKAVPPEGSNNKVTFRGTVDLAKFSGHAGYLYDDVTSALCTASPNQGYYFNISANSNTTQTASSFGVMKRFVYHTAFFDRLSPFA